MNILTELRRRTVKIDLTQIAVLMGYSKSQSSNATFRIHRVIQNINLGLDNAGYDFRYSDSEFVLGLCAVLKMDMAECSKQVKEISSQLFEARMAYKPWLSVITEPNPATLTIQVFGFPQGVRQIMLRQLAQILLHQQIREVKPIIIKHFEDNDGRLPLWGSIQRYKYFYAEKQSITFDTGGHVVDAGADFAQPAAKISIKGHDITKIILE